MSKIPEKKATKKQAGQAKALVAEFVALESNLRIELQTHEADQPQSAANKVKDLGDKVIEQYKTGQVEYQAVMEFYTASRVASDLGFMDDRIHQENAQIVYRAEKADRNSINKGVTRFAVSYAKFIELGTPLDETLLPKKAIIPPQSIEARRKAKIEPSKMETPELIEEYQLAKEKFQKRNAKGSVNQYTIARFNSATRAASVRFDSESKPLIDFDQHLADLTSIAKSDIHQLIGKEFEDAKALRDCAKDDVKNINDARKTKQAQTEEEPLIQINYNLKSEKSVSPIMGYTLDKLEDVMPILVKVRLDVDDNKMDAKIGYHLLQQIRSNIPHIKDESVLKEVTKFFDPKGVNAKFLENMERKADPALFNARQNYQYTKK